MSVFISCGTIKRATNLPRCKFRKKDIDKLNLGDVNVHNVNTLTDLGFNNIAKLGKSFSSDSLPFTLVGV